MAKLGFLKKEREKLTIKALYDRCDIILVPNKELENWLIVNGGLNSEIQDRIIEKVEEVFLKTEQFNCIGLHRKANNEFWMCKDNNVTVWKLTSNGRSYKLIFTAKSELQDTCVDFYSVKLDKKIYRQAANQHDLPDETKFLEIGNAGINFYFAFVNYYSLNPFIFYEDLTTGSNGKKNSNVLSMRKFDRKVIPLTKNHHKHKIRNGINVMNTETGVIYPSMAEAARRLDYMYGALCYWLSHNLIPPLKRIEKLKILKVESKME
jgi:hypothetical protein